MLVIIGARLEPQHRTPERDGAGFDDQMVVAGHQGPGEDSSTRKAAYFPDGRDELCRLERIVKDELSLCDAAIDVVRGFWDE